MDAEKKARMLLEAFSDDAGGRQVASAANQRVTEKVAAQWEAAGCLVSRQEFPCFRWQRHDMRLCSGDRLFSAHISPYSHACRLKTPLVRASSTQELRRMDGAGRIVLLDGELTRHQLMPKRFPFFQDAMHQEITNLLEGRGFAAVVAATGRDPYMAGGVYPFPLIEDGDFLLPSAYLTSEEGEELAQEVGKTVELTIDTERIHAVAANVVGSWGDRGGGKKIVVCAHMDTKLDTPGALDNAAGLVVLCLLADKLQGYSGPPCVELVAFNGEEHYAVPGQVTYLERHGKDLSAILLALNVDGPGYQGRASAYSVYQWPEDWSEIFADTIASHGSSVMGENWYQGDHMMFVQQGVPALAVTSEPIEEMLAVAHTVRDTVEQVCPERLVQVAACLHDLILTLAG